jgi:DNA-binding transcriptional LysR family regulator
MHYMHFSYLFSIKSTIDAPNILLYNLKITNQNDSQTVAYSRQMHITENQVSNFEQFRTGKTRGEHMSASFDSYKNFYYVGKYMNITRAAAALFLSQSTVSRGIQNLEAELGCQLFERTQRGVVFTAEGRVLYDHIARACESIFQGEEQVRRMLHSSSGHIRVGASGFAFAYFVLPTIRIRLDNPSADLDHLRRLLLHRSVFGRYDEGQARHGCLSSASPEELSGNGVEFTPWRLLRRSSLPAASFLSCARLFTLFRAGRVITFASLFRRLRRRTFRQALPRQRIQTDPEFTADSAELLASAPVSLSRAGDRPVPGGVSAGTTGVRGAHVPLSPRTTSISSPQGTAPGAVLERSYGSSKENIR